MVGCRKGEWVLLATEGEVNGGLGTDGRLGGRGAVNKGLSGGGAKKGEGLGVDGWFSGLGVVVVAEGVDEGGVWLDVKRLEGTLGCSGDD